MYGPSYIEVWLIISSMKLFVILYTINQLIVIDYFWSIINYFSWRIFSPIYAQHWTSMYRQNTPHEATETWLGKHILLVLLVQAFDLCLPWLLLKLSKVKLDKDLKCVPIMEEKHNCPSNLVFKSLMIS